MTKRKTKEISNNQDEWAVDTLITFLAKAAIVQLTYEITTDIKHHYLPIWIHMEQMLKPRNPKRYHMLLVKYSCRCSH